MYEKIKTGNKFRHPKDIDSERPLEADSHNVQSQCELRCFEKMCRVPNKTGSNRRAFSWRRKDSLLDHASRFDIVQRVERIKAVAPDG